MKALEFIAGALLLVAAAAFAAEGPRVRGLRVGEGHEEGVLLAIEEGRVALRTEAEELNLALEDFRELSLPGPSMTGLDPAFRVRLADGSQLKVRSIEAADGPERVRLEGYGWWAEGLPLEQVRSVVTRRFMREAAPQDVERFEARQQSPPRARDVLLAVRDGEHARASVVVTGMSAEGLAATVGDATRTVPWNRVGWVVLAGTEAPERREPRHTVELACASALRAESLALQESTLTARVGTAEYSIAAHRLSRVEVASDAYRYLSDMPPESIETEPYLDIAWPPRTDASVTGGPLRLDGATYQKGLGMHARTRMNFALDGAYDRFYATVGVDDAAGPEGSVVFRVLADDRELLSLEPMSGEATARPVSLDIREAERLTLITDWGDPFVGSGNLAVWAEARVARGRPSENCP